jgi:diguanylate cyclase (GGDEF)-like protein
VQTHSRYSVDPLFSLDVDALRDAEPVHDPLTQTLARRALLASLAQLKTSADRDGRPFALCLIDVDHLKNINDAYGQRVGDAVLIAVAGCILALIAEPQTPGQGHTLGRYDGDGLMLVTAPSTPDAAAALAERIRAAVSRGPLFGSVDVTVSIGVTPYRIGETLDAALARAEKSLHMAKQFGRDRVEFTPISVSPAPRLAGDSARRA